ncbi:hypothetical protein ABPG74_015849 [Tetrahymena malaccensis]
MLNNKKQGEINCLTFYLNAKLFLIEKKIIVHKKSLNLIIINSSPLEIVHNRPEKLNQFKTLQLDLQLSKEKSINPQRVYFSLRLVNQQLIAQIYLFSLACFSQSQYFQFTQSSCSIFFFYFQNQMQRRTPPLLYNQG